jgi:pimeloyl-ACP methyl ester carboxylesterase
MPFVINRGQKIHYTANGQGSLIVFQHGLFSDAARWKTDGFVDLFTDKYRVACVDSLGHGLSDKPSDPQLYSQEQRSGDIVAVIDNLGYERAHVIGYSMGGWLSVGVAKYHPRRLSSLVIGGWDIVNGAATAIPPGIDMPPSFDWLFNAIGAMAPELVEWVTPDAIPGLRGGTKITLHS